MFTWPNKIDFKRPFTKLHSFRKIEDENQNKQTYLCFMFNERWQWQWKKETISWTSAIYTYYVSVRFCMDSWVCLKIRSLTFAPFGRIVKPTVGGHIIIHNTYINYSIIKIIFFGWNRMKNTLSSVNMKWKTLQSDYIKLYYYIQQRRQRKEHRRMWIIVSTLSHFKSVWCRRWNVNNSSMYLICNNL